MEIILIPFALVIWLIPFFLILVSNRTYGKEKLAWLLALLFVSWFAWVFYLLLAPLKQHQANEYRY